MLSFFVARLQTRSNENAKEWVRSRYGRVLYEEFFASYNRKLWGVDMSEISAMWPDRRIKASLLRMIVAAIRRDNRSSVKTYDYPDRGASAIIGALTERIRSRPNVTIQTSTVPVSIHIENERIACVRTDDGREYPNPSYVISSIPIDEFIACIDDDLAPKKVSQRLVWRSVVTVNLVVPKEVNDWFTRHWVDVHDDQLLCMRLTNFGVISESMATSSHTSICVEYCCSESDPVWRATDEELVQIAISDIRKTFNRAPASIVSSSTCRIPKAYPVCLKNFDRDLLEIREFTDRIENLVLIGRSGTFQYNNMHEAINMGAFVAEHLRTGLAPEVWMKFHFAMRPKRVST
jgi:protoporphyrinogen oxidase